MQFICNGYWKDDGARIEGALIMQGTWDGIEGAADDQIFFYTDGAPVLGDHGEFVITHAELEQA